MDSGVPSARTCDVRRDPGRRPQVEILEEPPRFELGNGGFADHCLTTWLWLLEPSLCTRGRALDQRTQDTDPSQGDCRRDLRCALPVSYGTARCRCSSDARSGDGIEKLSFAPRTGATVQIRSMRQVPTVRGHSQTP